MNKGIIVSIEHCIQGGHSQRARSELSNIVVSKIPRPLAVSFADQARRIGMYPLALRILRPIVYPEKILDAKPNNKELLCYAMTLSLLGVKRQAEEIFVGIDGESNPEALLRFAFHLMTMWNYSKAKVLLKRYLRQDITEYQAVIARINLVPCLLDSGEYDLAIKEIFEIQKELDSEKNALLLGNSYELLGQCYFQLHRYKEARRSLNEAQERLARFPGRYLFYVQKWIFIADLYEHGPSDKNLSQLSRLQNEALRSGDWETIRDCELHQSIISKDQSLFNKVYFGTPYRSYRSSMRKTSLYDSMRVKDYLWSPSGETCNQYFDLETATSSVGQKLSPGGLLHKTIMVLSRDFYSPTYMGEVFEGVFPGENYDPVHSRNKVYQVLARLKKQIFEEGIPIQVIQNNGCYELQTENGMALRVTKNAINCSKEEVLFKRLRNKIVYNRFTRAEVCKLLSISDSSANKLLLFGVKSRIIQSSGRGPGICYKFSA